MRGKLAHGLSRRVPAARSTLLLYLLALSPALDGGARAVAVDGEGQIPEGQLRIHRFESSVFGNARRLRVLLPPGYDAEANASRRYPVLYLNDGQNLFDAKTSLFNAAEWQVDETVPRLIREGRIEPLIVVGIDSAGKSGRAYEYLPWEDVTLTPPVPDPAGQRYPDFFFEEVVPFVDRHYRTDPTPERRGLGGSSYGGLISLYTALAEPGRIGRLLIENPSLYVDDGRVLEQARELAIWPSRVYVGIGSRETGREDWNLAAIGNVLALQERILDSGYEEQNLLVVVEEGASHTETAWAKRLPAALEFLFCPPRDAAPSDDR